MFYHPRPFLPNHNAQQNNVSFSPIALSLIRDTFFLIPFQVNYYERISSARLLIHTHINYYCHILSIVLYIFLSLCNTLLLCFIIFCILLDFTIIRLKVSLFNIIELIINHGSKPRGEIGKLLSANYNSIKLLIHLYNNNYYNVQFDNNKWEQVQLKK